MKVSSLAVFIVVVFSVGIFAGGLQASETDSGYQTIVDGAKRMLNSNQKIIEAMSKKGLKDADLTAAEKEIKDGYDLILQGQGKASTNKPEAQDMLLRGGKMMLDGQNKVTSAVDKKGMTAECKLDVSECKVGQKLLMEGTGQFYFGSPF